MITAQEAVLRQTADWLAQHQEVWLCTVIQTWGSSPRPVGSLMAVAPGVAACGSVSGGCIEEALFDDLESGALTRRTNHSAGPWRVRYGHCGDDQARFALPCGGQLHLLLEHLKPIEETRRHFNDIVALLGQRQPCTREICLHSGQLGISTTPGDDAIVFKGHRCRQTLSPRQQVLLVGLGEVTRYTADFAQAVGFEVSICDMRPRFLELYPRMPAPIIHAAPDELIKARFSDRESAIITLSHDPRLDDLALLEAFESEAFFIGAMGSETTSAKRRMRLKSLGISDQALTRLHAPVGLPMHSKTPAEIALSAVAQLTATRNALQPGLSRRVASGYSEQCESPALR